MSQPAPVPSDRPRVAEAVIGDIQERMRNGAREYGTALQAHNGRRALQDLYEELLDGAHYVRQRLDEEDRVLRAVTGDESVRSTLSDIYSRVETVRKNPGRVNKQSLEQRYVDDLSYTRVVIESLLAELACASRTPLEQPERSPVVPEGHRPVPAATEPTRDSGKPS